MPNMDIGVVENGQCMAEVVLNVEADFGLRDTHECAKVRMTECTSEGR